MDKNIQDFKIKLNSFYNRIAWLEYRINLLNKMNSNSYKEKVTSKIDNDYFVIMNSLLESIVIFTCSIVEKNSLRGGNLRYTNIRGFIEELNKEFKLDLKCDENIMDPIKDENYKFMKEQRDQIIAHIDNSKLYITDVDRVINVSNFMIKDIKNTYDYLCEEILGYTCKPLPVSHPNMAGNGIKVLLDSY